jgi:hypothetical protein
MSGLGVAESRLTPPRVTPLAKEPVLGPARAVDDGRSPFAKMIDGLGREMRQGEGVMRGALGATQGGKDLGPAELIALQAGVYRYSEAVDLASRLVDRATSGVKTVLQGQ